MAPEYHHYSCKPKNSPNCTNMRGRSLRALIQRWSKVSKTIVRSSNQKKLTTHLLNHLKDRMHFRLHTKPCLCRCIDHPALNDCIELAVSSLYTNEKSPSVRRFSLVAMKWSSKGTSLFDFTTKGGCQEEWRSRLRMPAPKQLCRLIEDARRARKTCGGTWKGLRHDENRDSHCIQAMKNLYLSFLSPEVLKAWLNSSAPPKLLPRVRIVAFYTINITLWPRFDGSS